MAIEKLLQIEVPRRAQQIRVLLMELTRITSHLVALATGGMELGALTGMTAGFREREEGLHLMEFLTGLRMNMAFIRPGGVAQELPEGWPEKVAGFIKVMRERLPEYDKLLSRAANLEGSDGRDRRAAAGSLHAVGHHRPDSALGRVALGSAQDHALLAVMRSTTSRSPS